MLWALHCHLNSSNYSRLTDIKIRGYNLFLAVTSFNPMKNENDLRTTSTLCDSLVVIAARKHMKFVPARFCVLYEDDC